MNAQATRRGAPAAILWGGLGVLAWAAFTAVVGGGDAHADDGSDPSLLGSVTSVVSETVDTVGQTVTAVATPVVQQVVQPVVQQVAQPVVQQVAAPVQQAAPEVVQTVTDTVAAVPVVGATTAPVVETVTEVATGVVEPVADLLADAPVAQITQPVRDAVSALPIVGDLLADLGVTPVVDQVIDVVDEAVSVVGGVVETTVPPVLEGLVPAPAIADILAADAASGFADVAPGRAGGASISGPGSSMATLVDVAAPAAVHTAPATSAPVERTTGGAQAPGLGAPAIPSSSATSGGASALSHARVSGVDLPELRAWELFSGASDDVLPTSTVADTDVSPD